METRLGQEVDPEPCRPGEEASADEGAGGHDGFAVADDRHDALALVVEMLRRLALELVQDVGGGKLQAGGLLRPVLQETAFRLVGLFGRFEAGDAFFGQRISR